MRRLIGFAQLSDKQAKDLPTSCQLRSFARAFAFPSWRQQIEGLGLHDRFETCEQFSQTDSVRIEVHHLSSNLHHHVLCAVPTRCTGPLVSNRIHRSAAWLSEIEAVGFRRLPGRYFHAVHEHCAISKASCAMPTAR